MTTFECKQLSRLKYELNFCVPAVQVQKAFDQEYKNAQKKISIPGFRKGKTPISHIRKNYFKKIQYDVLQFLIEKSYTEGLSRHNLNPAGPPQIHFKTINESEDFNCKILLEIHPKIEVNEFENFNLKIKKSQVSLKQVDQVIENLRDSHSKIFPLKKDRPAQKGDIVLIDLSGVMEDGQNLPLQKDLSFELGKNRIMKDIEDCLIGARTGSEQKINSRFSKDHPQFSNKKVEFLVQVKKLSTKIKPDVNDEWAKKLNEKDVKSLKENIFKSLSDQAIQYDQEQLRQLALKQLMEKNPIEAPESVVMEQKKHLISSMESELKKQGLSENKIQEYIKKQDKELVKNSQKNAHASYLISTLAKRLRLEEKKDQIQDYIQRKKKNINSSVVENILWQRTQIKVLDYIVKKSKVTYE